MSSLSNTKQTALRQNPADLSHRESVVREAIEAHENDIKGDIRFYLLKFGDNRNLKERVEEIWHETVIEALKSAHYFDTTKPARPWLRVIAIRRVQKSWSDNKRRVDEIAPDETAAVKRRTGEAGNMSQTEMLDLLAANSAVAKFLHKAENADEILSVLPDEADREILRLRYVENVRGAELARLTGAPSEGAAQKAAARALEKLRRIYQSS